VLWDNQSPVFIAKSFKPASAKRTVDELYPDKDMIVAFGRFFISNQDLASEGKERIELVGTIEGCFHNKKNAAGEGVYDVWIHLARSCGGSV
jgi:NADPH2 dehydrogenase